MFRQVKSAVFWYYLYKFRKRVIIVVLLLLIALFSNAIYTDVIEYLKLKDKLQYLEIVLISKWVTILFSLCFSIYLILTMFKKEEDEKIIEKEKKVVKKDSPSKDELSSREKEFLHKKKLKNKADLLVDK